MAGPISSQESPRHGSRRFNIRHSALPSGMETSRPFLLLFPVTSGLREMRGGLVELEVRRTVGIDTPRPAKIVVLTGRTNRR